MSPRFYIAAAQRHEQPTSLLHISWKRRVHYTFNVAMPGRTTEARGLSASGALVALGNGLIDSQTDTAYFVRQTDEHEYGIRWERPGSNARTLEVTADGTLLTDLDSATTRSARGAVRNRFSVLGSRTLAITERMASGAVANTATRTLGVR